MHLTLTNLQSSVHCGATPSDMFSIRLALPRRIPRNRSMEGCFTVTSGKDNRNHVGTIIRLILVSLYRRHRMAITSRVWRGDQPGAIINECLLNLIRRLVFNHT